MPNNTERVREITKFVHDLLIASYEQVADHPDVDVCSDLCGFCATGAVILQKLLQEHGIEAGLVEGRSAHDRNYVEHYWVLALTDLGELVHADPTYLQFGGRVEPIRVDAEPPPRFRSSWAETHKIPSDWYFRQHPKTHLRLIGLPEYA